MSYMEGLEEGNPYVEDTHSITEHEKNKVTYKKGLQEGLFVEYSHPIIKFEENKVIYMEDLEKRKEAYGICGECNEPGTGEKWCQTCNAKRLKENFKFWTSGNKIIDEFIQKSQLEATHCTNCIEWIPFEKFHNVTYITKGGFGEIYSADFPEGFINCWDIDNQKWDNITNKKWVLKSLGNNNLTSEFLNEVGSHLQIFIQNVIVCRGITQDPSTNNYMMVLDYCDRGDLRNLNISELDYKERINILVEIARGLLEIHNAGKVHKDFHSGNILFYSTHYDERDIQSREGEPVFYYNIHAYISDLGLCRPVNNEKLSDEIRGIIPYMAPEVLRNQHPYTKAADIYSFGIIMNEFLSEEAPFYDSSYDHLLMVDICNGIRPRISKDIPKLFAGLIKRCWDPEIENRPTAKELFLILAKWQINILSDSLQDNEENNDNNSTCYSNFKDALENFKINKVEDDKDDENGKDDKDDDYGDDKDDNKDMEDIYLENIEDTYETIDYDESDCVGFFSEIYNQIKECEKIRENKLKDKNELKNIKATTYSQETYSSSLIPENESSQYRLISDNYSDCEID
ncbi:kinase-like domain-containing protein [Rhizophagus irregularis DAOM 181602=DAOM 197198]|nr:kinase-like domain-containing protein [Rhizophagus irregularis DAOM 181602=DAOM 197198]POG77582.1 kinase-like domain-containing protein [Rhizophagus irregularis DAOM 181602=DAOM 197198]|eukprot:XP_025184448.1 kinase-like domain-containing protein [Rhizophagus irregularis DAOM 181602=DAOM 197198]